MGIAGRRAAAVMGLLWLGHGHAQAQAQEQPSAASDAVEPGAATDSTAVPAEAARGGVPIRVAYTAHEECPNSNEFMARVLERTALARVAEPGEVARTLVVSIRRDGAASTGQISLADRNGVTSTREVAAASCDQVVTALALVASVCIAERAANSRSAAPSSAAAAPPPEPSAASSDTTPPTTTNSVKDADRASPPEPTPAGPEAARSVTVAVGANGELTNAYGELSVAPRVFGELGLDLGPLSDAALRLSLLYATNSEDVATADTDFSWWLARLGLCPLGLGDAVKLRPCVGLEGGVVHSDSTYRADVAADTSSSARLRFWSAGLAFLRLQLRLFGTAWVEADGGAAVPFTRYRFLLDERETDRTVRVVPRWGGFGAIGVGVGLL